jgi:hypothetical protein
VSTVRPPALLGSLVDLDVLNDEGTGVEALGVSVGLGVLEEAEKELGGLDGPAGLGDTELLACVKEIGQSMVQLCGSNSSSSNTRNRFVFIPTRERPPHQSVYWPLLLRPPFHNPKPTALPSSRRRA